METIEVNSHRLNRFLGITKVLSLLDYYKFNEYAQTMDINENNELFLGFKFYVKCVCNNIMESISRGDFLLLEDNIMVKRANFHGVPLSKLNNSCQKIIFLKNIKRLFEPLYESKNEYEYKKNYAKTKGIFLSMVDEYKKYLAVSKDFMSENIEEIILNLAIFWTYIDFNDTGRGVPLGYFFSLEEEEPSHASTEYEDIEERLRLFNGYKYTLVYVWNELLNREQKEKFPWEISNSNHWKQLDSYFGKIRTNIIEPIEKKHQLSMNDFFILNKFDDSLIPSFFSEPVNIPNLSFIEKLEQLLLWYPIQALPSEAVFSGASSCVITIEGNIGLKYRLNVDEKIIIIRFTHPEEYGTAFSYAVLIDAFGTIADYSGWLLFYNIGADYGGFSYGSYRYVEETLASYPDGVEIYDYEIKSKELLRYINSKSYTIKDVIEENNIPQDTEQMLRNILLQNSFIQEVNRNLKDINSASRGILLELVAYYYFSCKGEKTILRYKNRDLFGQTDLDVITKIGNEIFIISCMCSFNLVKIEKLNQIISIARKHGLDLFPKGEYRFKPVLFILKEPNSSQKEIIRENAVSILILEELLESEPCFTRIDIPEIKRILFTDNS